MLNDISNQSGSRNQTQVCFIPELMLLGNSVHWSLARDLITASQMPIQHSPTPFSALSFPCQRSQLKDGRTATHASKTRRSSLLLQYIRNKIKESTNIHAHMSTKKMLGNKFNGVMEGLFHNLTSYKSRLNLLRVSISRSLKCQGVVTQNLNLKIASKSSDRVFKTI